MISGDGNGENSMWAILMANKQANLLAPAWALAIEAIVFYLGKEEIEG